MKRAALGVIALCLTAQTAHAHAINLTGTHFAPYMDQVKSAIVHVARVHIDPNGAPVQVQQYPVIEKIRFNSPENARYLKDKSYGVFLPEGGNVPYEKGAAEYMADGKDADWVFNAEFDNGDFRQRNLDYPEKRIFNEIIAFLIGIKKEECEEVMEAITGKRDIPRLRSDQSALYKKSMVATQASDYTVPYSKGPAIDSPEAVSLRSGCFLSHDGKDYVFFSHVLEN